MIHFSKHQPSYHRAVIFCGVRSRWQQQQQHTVAHKCGSDRVCVLPNKITPLNKHSRSLSFTLTFTPLSCKQASNTHTHLCHTLFHAVLILQHALGSMEMPDEIFMTPLLLDARHDATHDAIDDDTPSHGSCVRTANRTGISPPHFFSHQPSASHFF